MYKRDVVTGGSASGFTPLRTHCITTLGIYNGSY